MTVLVVGGGMAGLSATLSLRGAGIDVEVIERDPAWGVYGVGIIQPANALRAPIGDAVHGTSPHAGQGAAQALDDGIVLGQELGRGLPLEHSLPIDPDATRAQVGMSAAMPI